MQVGKSKIGRFFFFIGLILLVVFFAVDQSVAPILWLFLCWGDCVIARGDVNVTRPEAATR